VDRLLIVVANDTQRRQMVNDFAHDCRDVALEIPQVMKANVDESTLRANRTGKHCVFVVTIQQVSAANRGLNWIAKLMEDCGKWMVAADEYHHYATDMDWGHSLSVILDHAVFQLATSATPYRDTRTKNGETLGDTIFGAPDLIVTYHDAKLEDAVKPIFRAKNEYRIDYIDQHNEPVQFTTDELREAINSAADVDQFEAKRRLRHSGKYVMPILSHSLARLGERRIASGLPLQMLVRAMGCNHARLLCEQIAAISDGLAVDWIGTGDYGRSDQENIEVKQRFCPRKNTNGERPDPTLDILVQVGMADEGFDSLLVCEIVDLAIVTLEGSSNKTKQFYKRGTRYVAGQSLYINVGTDHPLAVLEDGVQVEEWLDGDRSIEAIAKEVEPGQDQWPEDYDWPEELPGREDCFLDCVWTDRQIDEHPKKAKFDAMVREARPGREFKDDELRDLFRRAMSTDAGKEVTEVTLEKQRSMIDKCIGQIALLALKAKGGEFEKSQLGDYKKRINRKAISNYGKRSAMLFDELSALYGWLKSLQMQIKEGEVPAWLR
jgi:hypothetical protein